jgi:hypothetical protein
MTSPSAPLHGTPWKARLWGSLAIVVVLLAGLIFGLHLRAQHRWQRQGFRMAPGTDRILVTRHNDSSLVDIDGWDLKPAFVRACLQELAATPAGNNQVTCLAKPVPRAVPGVLPQDSEGAFTFHFKGVPQDRLQAYCASLEALPPMPRPLGEIVVRRVNLPIPGAGAGEDQVDFWTPTSESFHGKSPARLLLAQALREMQATQPTPGQIQVIRKPFGSPLRNWFRQTRSHPVVHFNRNLGRLVSFLDLAFQPAKAK